MGAALLIAGIVAAIATAPLFDRVLTHHLSITLRILCPLIGSSWLSLIWAGELYLCSYPIDPLMDLTFDQNFPVRQ